MEYIENICDLFGKTTVAVSLNDPMIGRDKCNETQSYLRDGAENLGLGLYYTNTVLYSGFAKVVPLKIPVRGEKKRRFFIPLKRPFSKSFWS